WCWDDGQNGSGTASSATIKADCTYAISGLYSVTGTPTPVKDCDPQPADCSSWHYIDVNRIATVDNSFSTECPSLSGGGTSDSCFQHHTAQNSSNRIYPVSGTCPSSGTIINMNFGFTGVGLPNTSLAWWNAYVQ